MEFRLLSVSDPGGGGLLAYCSSNSMEVRLQETTWMKRHSERNRSFSSFGAGGGKGWLWNLHGFAVPTPLFSLYDSLEECKLPFSTEIVDGMMDVRFEVTLFLSSIVRGDIHA